MREKTPAIKQQNRLRWLLFCSVTGFIFIVYVLLSLADGRSELLLPLDDVYIHFQYAKQLALGQPYIYNPGDPATSGATSLLYPPLLAMGYTIGFQGLMLGLWAMFIGAGAHLLSQWAMYRICKTLAIPEWLSLSTAVLFALTGTFAWHFMSGMETGLVICFTLLTLLAFLEKRLFFFVIVATLLALTRPEASAMAGIAAVLMLFRLWQTTPKIRLILLVIPVLAIFIQPVLNYLLTGSFTAAGTLAKSILYTIPQDWHFIISRILENFARIWTEFFTGYSPQNGWYLLPLIAPIAMMGIIFWLFKRDMRLIAVLLILWMLAVTGAVSTLDNAFWHFKRYQMPMMALFFPVAAWVVSYSLLRLRRTHHVAPLLQRYAAGEIVVIIAGFSIALFLQFAMYYAVNVGYVYAQPYQMALWLNANTPDNARVAVHDVGMMRYMGERYTLDMVGLTTPGAAQYWRNGPGSVGEFLFNTRPDYIASYGQGHGYGLYMLEESALYDNPQAIFTVNLQPHLNVALAADTQGIYQPDWEKDMYLYGNEFHSYVLFSPYTPPDGVYIARDLNVADLAREDKYNYQFDAGSLSGFPTELKQFLYTLDAYRVLSGEEAFTFEFDVRDAVWMVLVTRVHASAAGTLDIYINDEFVDRQWIPEMPGQWFYISTLIDPKYLAAEKTEIRIVPDITDGYYMPAYHAIWRYIDPYSGLGDEQLEKIETEKIADFQDGNFYLSSFNAYSRENILNISMRWFVENHSTGDYRLFVHLYEDINQPPVAQWDDYVAGMPSGNWLPGALLEIAEIDTVNIAPSTYQLAIGFYNPYTNERLMPESDTYDVLPDGRLLLEPVEID